MSCAALTGGAGGGKPCLFHADGGHRTAVHRLLAIAGIAGRGIDDPRFIVPKFKDLRAELGAESTADTGIHVDRWGCHVVSSLV